MIARVLGVFVVSLAVGAYAATLSLLVTLVLAGVTFLVGLLPQTPSRYGIAVVAGVTFGAGIASFFGWATPAMIG